MGTTPAMMPQMSGLCTVLVRQGSGGIKELIAGVHWMEEQQRYANRRPLLAILRPLRALPGGQALVRMDSGRGQTAQPPGRDLLQGDARIRPPSPQPREQ